MPVKEYQTGGYCEEHTDVKLTVTGDDNLDTWYECPTCRREDNVNFFAFIENTASKMGLKPVYSGGNGKGVQCPCCEGNQYVTSEYAEKAKELLKEIDISPFLPIRKIKLNEKGQAILKG